MHTCPTSSVSQITWFSCSSSSPCVSFLLSNCSSACCLLIQDTELFEIIEKLQVRNSKSVCLIVCGAWALHSSYHHALLLHQGSRLNEQRCEFPLPLKVSYWPRHSHISLKLHAYTVVPTCAHVYVVVWSSWPLILKGLPFLFSRVLAAHHRHHPELLCVYFSLRF